MKLMLFSIDKTVSLFEMKAKLLLSLCYTLGRADGYGLSESKHVQQIQVWTGIWEYQGLQEILGK